MIDIGFPTPQTMIQAIQAAAFPEKGWAPLPELFGNPVQQYGIQHEISFVHGYLSQ